MTKKYNDAEIISKIAEIYGNTNSLEGTYKLFLELKHKLEELETENQDLKDNEKIITDYGYNLVIENKKLKKAIEILKDRIRPILISSNGAYILRTNAWS